MVYLCIHPDYHRRWFLLVPGPSFLVSTSNPKPGPLFQYGAPPFKLAPPPNTRKNSRACLPRLQLRNVGYNKTTLRSGCTLFLTRVSNVTVRLSANDSRVAKRVPKEGSADRHGIPRAHSNQCICKKKHILELWIFFLLGRCISVSMLTTLKVVSSSTGPVYGACKRFWESQTRNNV